MLDRDPNGKFVVYRKVYLIKCKFTGEVMMAYDDKRIAQIRCRDYNDEEGQKRFKVEPYTFQKKKAA